MKTLFVLLLLTTIYAFGLEYRRVDQNLIELDAASAKIRAELQEVPEEPNNKNWVKLKVDNMFRIDQHLRRSTDTFPTDNFYTEAEKRFFLVEIFRRVGNCDDENLLVLKSLLGIYRWFTISEFGGKTDPRNYAYMFDRVAASWNDPTKRNLQRYGTQGTCVGPGKWEPLPMEEPTELDKRRAEVGLPTMAEYQNIMNEFCK